jgi:predicted hotdog family 3-hydroxylacyl-ACP dehydratase
VIAHDEICRLIPHDGSMCLLDRVVSWDDDTIICESSSHISGNNPLCSGGRLSSISLIEYGAQAVAVHGGLLARESGASAGGGYLAALRDVTMIRCDVDTAGGELVVAAERLMSQDGSMVYRFEISQDAVALVSGRATIVEI